MNERQRQIAADFDRAVEAGEGENFLRGVLFQSDFSPAWWMNDQVSRAIAKQCCHCRHYTYEQAVGNCQDCGNVKAHYPRRCV